MIQESVVDQEEVADRKIKAGRLGLIKLNPMPFNFVEVVKMIQREQY